jgi:2-polyprenyl-3-methyl-5-hydroxy-6-metoxy-1,4-benzoquinol methylase
MTDYRQRIYPRYTTQRMAHTLRYTEAEYNAAARAIAHRIRGWLPDVLTSRCLDVACGPGEVLHLLKTHGYQDITGIDISPEQIATAMRVWPNVVQAEAIQYLKSNRAAFDLITAFDIVEHFKKEELFDFLESLNAAMRPGGTLILQTPNAESPWGMKHRYHDLTHELAFDPSCLAYALSLVGFEGCEARECGPYVHGMKSLVRVGLWKCIHAGLSLWNLAETGNRGSRVYTRVFMMRAAKRKL